jgi:hypothetical protein
MKESWILAKLLIVFILTWLLSSCATSVSTKQTPTPTLASFPSPTMTDAEKAAAEAGRFFEAYRKTEDECYQAVSNGDLRACVAPDEIRIVSSPEWVQLFSDTVFYEINLVGYVDHDGQIDRSYRRRLIAWQDNQPYSIETFEHLLEANTITTITDETRELVAKSLALMTIPGYYEEEIVFTDWENGDWSSPIRLNFNYTLTAWTKLNGLKIRWYFIFDEGLLLIAEGVVEEYNVGDYIDASFDVPPPHRDSLIYGRK